MENIYNWDEGETIKYSENNLSEFKLNDHLIIILNKIGLPIINTDYYKFFPNKKLKLIQYDNQSFLSMGRRFRENDSYSDDNIIVMNLKNNKIYFLSEAFFEIGFVPEKISIVNDDINSFLIFNSKIKTFIEVVFLERNGIVSFIDASHLYKELLYFLDKKDKIGLGWDIDHRLYWGKVVFELSIEIAMKYNKTFNINNFMDRPPTFGINE